MKKTGKTINTLTILYISAGTIVLIYDFFGDYLKEKLPGYKEVNLILTLSLLFSIVWLEFKKYAKL